MLLTPKLNLSSDLNRSSSSSKSIGMNNIEDVVLTTPKLLNTPKLNLMTSEPWRLSTTISSSAENNSSSDCEVEKIRDGLKNDQTIDSALTNEAMSSDSKDGQSLNAEHIDIGLCSPCDGVLAKRRKYKMKQSNSFINGNSNSEITVDENSPQYDASTSNSNNDTASPLLGKENHEPERDPVVEKVSETQSSSPSSTALLRHLEMLANHHKSKSSPSTPIHNSNEQLWSKFLASSAAANQMMVAAAASSTTNKLSVKEVSKLKSMAVKFKQPAINATHLSHHTDVLQRLGTSLKDGISTFAAAASTNMGGVGLDSSVTIPSIYTPSPLAVPSPNWAVIERYFSGETLKTPKQLDSNVFDFFIPQYNHASSNATPKVNSSKLFSKSPALGSGGVTTSLPNQFFGGTLRTSTSALSSPRLPIHEAPTDLSSKSPQIAQPLPQPEDLTMNSNPSSVNRINTNDNEVSSSTVKPEVRRSSPPSKFTPLQQIKREKDDEEEEEVRVKVEQVDVTHDVHDNDDSFTITTCNEMKTESTNPISSTHSPAHYSTSVVGGEDGGSAMTNELNQQNVYARQLQLYLSSHLYSSARMQYANMNEPSTYYSNLLNHHHNNKDGSSADQLNNSTTSCKDNFVPSMNNNVVTSHQSFNHHSNPKLLTTVNSSDFFTQNLLSSSSSSPSSTYPSAWQKYQLMASHHHSQTHGGSGTQTPLPLNSQGNLYHNTSSHAIEQWNAFQKSYWHDHQNSSNNGKYETPQSSTKGSQSCYQPPRVSNHQTSYGGDRRMSSLDESIVSSTSSSGLVSSGGNSSATFSRNDERVSSSNVSPDSSVASYLPTSSESSSLTTLTKNVATKKRKVVSTMKSSDESTSANDYSMVGGDTKKVKKSSQGVKRGHKGKNNNSGGAAGCGNGSGAGGSAGHVFTCPHCDRSYDWNYNLNRHLKYECGKENSFQCGQCNRKFPHKQNCVYHLKRKHKIVFDTIDQYVSNKLVVFVGSSTSSSTSPPSSSSSDKCNANSVSPVTNIQGRQCEDSDKQMIQQDGSVSTQKMRNFRSETTESVESGVVVDVGGGVAGHRDFTSRSQPNYHLTSSNNNNNNKLSHQIYVHEWAKAAAVASHAIAASSASHQHSLIGASWQQPF